MKITSASVKNLALAFLFITLAVAALRIARAVELVQQHADRVLTEAGLTAKEARLTSVEQRDFLKTMNGNVLKIMGNMNTVLVHTDQTVLALNAAVKKNSADSAALLKDARKSVQDMQPVLKDMDRSAKQLDSLLADPNLPKTIANVQLASAHTVTMTANGAATSQDIKETVHEATHPKHHWWTATKGVAGVVIVLDAARRIAEWF